MPNEKDHETMKKLDKCYNVVLQSSTKGISAVEIAEKLNVHRTTAYDYLRSLDLMGKVENKGGTWYAKTGEQTAKPLEREIVIELPMPKGEWQRMVVLEQFAQDWEKTFPNSPENLYRISLNKLRETRTIRITGKNVEDLDLEKLGNLVQQANKRSSKVDFSSLFKNLKERFPSKKARA
jgi:sugar-specific transcriptional regulator TrmB